MTTKAYHEEIRSLFRLVPARPGWRRPEFILLSKRKYRGRERYVAGYSHSRMYANSMSGMTTERVCGTGDTPEAAISDMRARLQKPPASPK